MNRIDNIEKKITEALQTIDGAQQPSGYTYYSTTGQVQIYDEALNIARNTNNKYVNHILEQEENVGVQNSEYQVGQYAYNQSVVYTIRSKVYNTGAEPNAKNAIRSKMNDVLDDLLYLFGNNYTLNGQVSLIKFGSAYREYEDITNNRIQSGTLITNWEVQFTQSIANPSIRSCA